MIRRDFLKNTAVLSAASIVLPDYYSLMSNTDLGNIGLQLYTVREDMTINPIDTLRKIAAMGYKHVECAGYLNGKFYGHTRENFKIILADYNLQMLSGHTNTGFGKPEGTYSMKNNWEKYCEDAAFIGQKYIASAYFDEKERKSIDDYKRHADLFNSCAETAKKYNLTFCHHNHDFEFIPINGVVPYDILLNETDKNLVKFELDHYWTTKVNVDSTTLIKSNPGRFPLWHIKDMENTPAHLFTEVGTGIIDYKNIFKAQKEAGLDLFFIEQDSNHKGSALNSIEISINNFKKILG